MKKPKLRRIKIRKKAVKGQWGGAYADQWMIVLDPRLDDKTLLDIASHETVHVLLPMLDEETVDFIGRHLADVLIRLGFHRNDPL